MIKASGESDGIPLLLIGLTGENMTRLMCDEPIRIDAASIGLPNMVVLIVGGCSEESIKADLMKHCVVRDT
jgi:hypothetical protein